MEKVYQEGKIITVIMPKGKGLDLVQALYDKGYRSYSFTTVRGYDARDINKKGLPLAVEKDMIMVKAKNTQEGEEIFDFIYYTAKLNEPRGGIMYMSKLGANSHFSLPNL